MMIGDWYNHITETLSAPWVIFILTIVPSLFAGGVFNRLINKKKTWITLSSTVLVASIISAIFVIPIEDTDFNPHLSSAIIGGLSSLTIAYTIILWRLNRQKNSHDSRSIPKLGSLFLFVCFMPLLNLFGLYFGAPVIFAYIFPIYLTGAIPAYLTGLVFTTLINKRRPILYTGIITVIFGILFSLLTFMLILALLGTIEGSDLFFISLIVGGSTSGVSALLLTTGLIIQLRQYRRKVANNASIPQQFKKKSIILFITGGPAIGFSAILLFFTLMEYF